MQEIVESLLYKSNNCFIEDEVLEIILKTDNCDILLTIDNELENILDNKIYT